MPLNLSNRDQSSGHLFYHRRLKAAITRFSVRMKHDDRKQQAALALSVVFVMIGAGWMALLHVLKPAGLAGSARIVGDRATGALYAKIDGRLYPALNLISARLAVGSAATPVWVDATEIAGYPTGPVLGIPGAPGALEVTAAPSSAWAICDTAGTRGGQAAPTVTAVAGRLAVPGRAISLAPTRAILTTHRGGTYLIWGARRSRIDPTNRPVTFTLGLDPGRIRPVEISTALFDAIPAAEPLVLPQIPESGAPSRWLPDATVGTVLQTRDTAGTVTGFYVLLADGVQQVSHFVADLLRTADARGDTPPRTVAPGRLIGIPDIHTLDVDHYPTGRMDFVDTAAEPVTCLSWAKHPTDPQATITILTGRGLPVSSALDARTVRLVRADRSPESVEADRTLMLPGAANFVATTGGAAFSESRESLYWVSPQGVRYGIQRDRGTLQALGLNPDDAVQAPWPILRSFAPGPAISREDALLARDAVTADGARAPLAASDRAAGS